MTTRSVAGASVWTPTSPSRSIRPSSSRWSGNWRRPLGPEPCVWRSGTVPGWAALVLGVSQPLRLVTVITAVPKLLDGGRLGADRPRLRGGRGLSLVRGSDDDFDLSLRPRG